ncbi:DUF4258 domain-containing protein (plasmid) [Paenibacillus urinalis]|uniref:DUF4258 domain-containing protein n=2 Tax=Paenibacillus TaxID=44249 RepID=A0AAX3N6H1_9BACL|nr:MULTISPECIES: DUF4258 domain-containing protein [Paenibacillus]MCM3130527.1 DUF4258 domain-containing protein [Paenibacillus sp. MER 78]WDH85413.1 DUF4258 domain-containing protein [Paenibacillus urinalis]WDH95149.1 DUF4258 domain-containing protein [Paenibacillus urinalis]WDI05379.1 DUF4258 domain-containing protein [Paenibacillus urinalis]SDX62934.1 hypothetical protein SAMN05518848_11078 [Paenibacillus sp. PDC88]
MDYRKENWSYELECFRKAVNGGVDGFIIEIADHYLNDRLDNEEYEDRTYTQIDIAVAIFNGKIIEGYSSEDNRIRESRSMGLVTPSRLVLGKDLQGNWFIIVVGLLTSKHFKVVTCYPPGKRHLPYIENF